MLLDKLRGGTRQTLGRSKAVARQILAHPELLPELLEAFATQDRVLISRAADALEAIGAGRPALLLPHKQFILTLLTQFDFWEVREHVCLMLPRLRLTSDERLQAFDTVREWLGDRSSIVRTFALQTMWDLGSEDASLREEAIAHLQQALVHGTPAMKARARILLGLKRGPRS
ncbi:MAG: hypothetical protein JNK48_01800 [Bryobacterales bacterium]|nr:hypothetical protein [Bryobacterales bacterium]